MNISENWHRISTPVCRVCLGGNLRMYCIENIENQKVFEKLTRIKLSAECGGMNTMCFICYWQLQKCHRFVDMARRSDTILKDLFVKGFEATQETLTMFKVKHTLTLAVSSAQSMSMNYLVWVDATVKQEVSVKQELTDENDSDVEKDILKDDIKPVTLEDHFPSATKDVQDQRKPGSTEKSKPARSRKSVQARPGGKLEQGVKKRKNVRYGVEDRTCEFCKRIFKRRNELIVHRRIHTGERPFACDECDKSFTSNSTLKMHTKTHTSERPLTCDRCARTFKTLRVLRHHMLVHSSERPYACDSCDKRFARNMELTFHRRIHTGEKPYSCDICGKTFAQSGTMTSHRRTHSTERPFVCDKCNFKFKDKIALVRHMECHGATPSQCAVCGRECASRRSAQAHARSHSRTHVPRPACLKCSKTFKNIGHLRRHNKNVRCTPPQTDG